jgi:N6-adenosine-specific RNA methylase IME4
MSTDDILTERLYNLEQRLERERALPPKTARVGFVEGPSWTVETRPMLAVPPGAGPFPTIVVDWPWKFKDKLPDTKAGRPRGAERTYRSVISPDDGVELVKRGFGHGLVLPPLAADCAMFFWRVAAMQQDAFRILDAWGFAVASEIVWIKTADRAHRGQLTFVDDADEPLALAKARMGMGRIVRHEHEVCLIARRGKPKARAKNVRSTFRAPVGAHSEKPPEFYRIVERLYDGPYVDLFARATRPGWTALGDEVTTMEGTR